MASLRLAMAVDATNPVIGDIYIGPDGTDRMCATLFEEAQQLLYTQFRFFQGEWFLDPALGIPYYQSILGIKVALPVVAQIFRQVITGCPGVAALQSFALVPTPGRGATLTFACRLTNGQVLKSSDFPRFVIGSLLFGGA